MFTIFSCPKPFSGNTKDIQINAVKSWLSLSPAPEVILIGDEYGVPEFCKKLNIRNICGVRKNQFGTPLVNSVFEIGQREASNQIVCYINTDIIVTKSFQMIFEYLPRYPKMFMVTGRRWDIEDGQKCSSLRHYGMDYFVFRKMSVRDMPPFAIGRNIWDNWLAYFCLKNNFTLIDTTEVVRVLHQAHDYQHIKIENAQLWKSGEEAKANLMLAGKNCIFTIDNATYRLTERGIKFRFFVFLLNFLIMLYLKSLLPRTLILKFQSVNHILTKRRLRKYFILEK
jgi:hypothetical protein